MDSKALHNLAAFEVMGFRVDPARLRVVGPDGETRLEARAMQVLVYLAQRAGEVVARSELEQNVWSGRIVTEDAVTNSIAKLRRAFADDARHPRLIETVPKIGYRLVGTVAPIEGNRPSSDGGDAAVAASTVRRIWRVPVAAAVLLVLAAIGLALLPAPTELEPVPLDDRPSIAILPFENLGDSPQQDYFANGITADLITDLSKLTSLLVIAPGSVFGYRGGARDAREASSDLGVRYVVVGSVQRSGNRVRVNVQLFEAAQEHAVWGERYEGTLQDVFDIQDRLTAAVTTALKIELEPIERALLAKRPTASISAYDYFLRGLEEHGHRTAAENEAAKSHFEEAIRLDPTFARAYAGLAMAHSRDAIDGWTDDPSRSLDLAWELAQKAEEMDPSIPQVHFVAGQVELFRGHHLQAIEAAQRATRVDPNYADAYALSAWILNYAGRPAEALDAMEQALRLNPRPSASYLEVLGEIYFAQSRYPDAASTFEEVLNINPDYTRARMWMVAVRALQNDPDEAAWEATQLLMLNPDVAPERLTFAFPFKDPRVLQRLQEGLRRAEVLE